VQLADMELLTEQTSRMYVHAPLRVDPREAVAMAQCIRDRGMSVDDQQLTEASVGKIGANLHSLLQEQRMALPGESDLIVELLSVRLKATGLGGMRLDHDAGNHDDQAMSLGLAALALVEHPVSELGGFSIPRLLIAARKSVPQGDTGLPGSPSLINAAYRNRATRGELAAISAAKQNQTEAQRRAGIGLVVQRSANDPSRVKRV
jgi:hypothetical protein